MEPTRRSFLTTVAAAPFVAAAAPGRLPIKKAVEYSMIQPRTLSAIDKFKIAKEAGFEEIECPTTPDQAKAEEILAESNIEKVQLGIAQGPFDFIVERLRYYAGTAGGITRNDVIDAVLTPTNTHALSFKELLERMKALESVTAKPEFDPLIIGFKRAHRLVEKEKDRVVFQPVNPALFQHPSETKLREAWEKNDQLVRHLIAVRKYSKALEAFVSMKPAIDDFFAAVMVNADEPSIRINRLSLLKDIDELFLLFADFSQIVVQGS